MQLISILIFLHILTFNSLAKTIIDCEYIASVVEEQNDLPVGILSSISNVGLEELLVIIQRGLDHGL